MNRAMLKPIGWAMLGGGLAVMTTAGAFDLPWFGGKDKSRPPAAVTQVAAAANIASAPPLPQLPPGTAPNYRGIVQQYGPAVVGVTVEGVRKTSNEDGGPAMRGNDPMERFFRGLPGWRGQMPDQPFKGQGSGFIVSPDGLILTLSLIHI